MGIHAACLAFHSRAGRRVTIWTIGRATRNEWSIRKITILIITFADKCRDAAARAAHSVSSPAQGWSPARHESGGIAPMGQHRNARIRPELQQCEERLLQSAVTMSQAPAAAAEVARHHMPGKPRSFLAFRVTQKPYVLIPPFQQVLVQSLQPVPGQVYNVNSISLKNTTAQTFDATSGFTVRLNNQPKSFAFPILTGSEQWKPQQVIVFYVLTKRYYPVSFVPGGFQFNLGGRSSTLIPGPSAIFLRLKYNPATFARTLDWITAFGPGAQGGLGPKFGMPDTSINSFVAAQTRRIDFGGHF
jgi:hypothetical protein